MPRRLALRNASRRGGDALLVVLGCALGTAIITSSLSVGDSLDASMRARAPETLGPVDAVVRSYSYTDVEVAESLLRTGPSVETDGFLDVVAADAALSTTGDGERRVVPSARLMEVKFGEARSFGGEPGATGIDGPTPGAGEVVLGRDTAEELGVRAGASVEVHSYGQTLQLEVDRVLPRLGVAGYATPFDDGSTNAFVAPGTIDELSFPAMFAVDAAPPENLLFVSAPGGVFPGPGRNEALLEQMRERLKSITGGYELDPVKGDLLRAATEEGDEFSELFLSLASFAVLAGVALLVNTLVMLAGERRRELGVLRSMGLKRGGLIGASLLEGGTYAAVGAACGAAAGVGAAYLVVRLAGGLFSSATRGSVETMRFGFEPATPLAGFLLGLAVSLAVVVATSVWTGRMTVVEAIRDLPPGLSARRPARQRLPLSLVACSLGAGAALAASVLAIVAGNDLGSLAFPCLALALSAATAVGVSAQRYPAGDPKGDAARRLVVGGAAVAAMLWAVLAFRLLDLDGDDTVLFVVQGLVLALAAVVLVVQYGRRLGPVLGRAGGGYGLALRLALAYPADRRFRTGATLLAYALIVFTLVFSAVLSGTFAAQEERLAADEGGGYDLLVTRGSGGPIGTEELEAVRGVEDAAKLSWTVTDFRVGGDSSGAFEGWAVSGFDEDFLKGGPPALETFDRERYPDEAAVWEAVRKDPGLAIADVAFLETGGGPPEDNVAVGDTIQIKASETKGPVSRRVVAISAAGAAFSGVMVSRESLAAFVEDPAGNRHYVDVAAGSDPGAVAGRLQERFLRNGIEASTFEEVVREALRGQEAFFDLIEGYLALGLLIGVAGLGVTMIRAVRERRRTVAVLRALGLSAPMVRAALLAESGLIALAGVLIGAALALVTSYGLVTGSDAFGDADVAFTVPWALLALLILGVLLASLLVALPSAVRATKTPPASALRTVEEGAV